MYLLLRFFLFSSSFFFVKWMLFFRNILLIRYAYNQYLYYSIYLLRYVKWCLLYTAKHSHNELHRRRLISFPRDLSFAVSQVRWELQRHALCYVFAVILASLRDLRWTIKRSRCCIEMLIAIVELWDEVSLIFTFGPCNFKCFHCCLKTSRFAYKSCLINPKLSNVNFRLCQMQINKNKQIYAQNTSKYIPKLFKWGKCKC